MQNPTTLYKVNSIQNETTIKCNTNYTQTPYSSLKQQDWIKNELQTIQAQNQQLNQLKTMRKRFPITRVNCNVLQSSNSKQETFQE